MSSPLEWDGDNGICRTGNIAVLGYEKEGETSSALRVDPRRRKRWLNLGQLKSETGKSRFVQTSRGREVLE